MLLIFCRDLEWINVNQQETPIALGTNLTKNGDEPAVNNTLYKQMVGSLMYLTTTRPDLMYAVNLISSFMESPKNSH